MMKILFYSTFIISLLFEVSCFKNTSEKNTPSHVNKEILLKEKVSIINYGVKVNSKEDQTALIQNAFKESASNNQILVIKKGLYYINGIGDSDNKQYLFDRGGIKVHENTHVIFEEGAIFKVLPNNFSAYNALRIWDVSNVIIEGANLVGDRNEHKGNTGEWGYGIFIAGSKNITIKNAKISEFWGDGINLNCSFINSNLKVNHNIVIDNVHSFNNRRQGMSIEAGKYIVVKNSTFENNRGTNPQSGIDIEPWGTEYDYVDNVTIDNCVFVDNPNGIMVNFPTLKNIVIKNCEFKATKKGLVERHIWQLYGDNEVTIDNCKFDESATNILINSGKTTTINNCVFKNDVVLDALTDLNVRITNSNFNKAFVTVRNTTKGNLFVLDNNFINNSSVELRGGIVSDISNNIFKNSEEIFISEQSSGKSNIHSNNFKNSRFQAITTDGNTKFSNNESIDSEVFIVLKENANNVTIENNVIDTKIKQSLSFVKVNSNENISITNNKMINNTKMIKDFQFDLLNNSTNHFIENNTFKVLRNQKLPNTYIKGKKVSIIN